MKGNRVDYAFSNYARFKQLNKFEKEALEFNKRGFSIIDIHDKVFENPQQSMAFSKQQARTDMFLKPELLKQVEVEKAEQQVR